MERSGLISEISQTICQSFKRSRNAKQIRDSVRDKVGEEIRIDDAVRIAHASNFPTIKRGSKLTEVRHENKEGISFVLHWGCIDRGE